MNTFQNTVDVLNTLSVSRMMKVGKLSNEDNQFLRKIKNAWNFYEGFHWEGIEEDDSPQVTFNYCRPFVNKFVAFELGKSFTIETPIELDDVGVTEEKRLVLDLGEEGADDDKLVEKSYTLLEFLKDVWNYNNKEVFCTEMGQTKSITGEAWVKVQYQDTTEFEDIFDEYPNGKMRVTVVPTHYVFPKFNQHDKDKLDSLVIMYPIDVERESLILRSPKTKTVMYKEVWNSKEIRVFEDEEEIDVMDNPYGFIPFVQIKNYILAGRTRGQSDIEDVVPLNVEYNIKKSDVSEVIDYHSAPITLVYGAKIGNLEKGANKVWGGLPRDARVENLGLKGDLVASNHYIGELKTSMCEVAGIPESSLGGTQAISNTSGIAMQYVNLPLIDRTNVKRSLSANGLKLVNKYIVMIALYHGLITKPENISIRDFTRISVSIPSTLPKDELMELQKIQQEMKLGLESRRGALERLGCENVTRKLKEVDKERQDYPEFYGLESESQTQDVDKLKKQFSGMSSTNAGGIMNGSTPLELLRKEMKGKNGGGTL